MDISRRKLLEFFRLGAVITPVAAGAPVLEAAARLLDTPRVELVQAPQFPDGHVPTRYADRLKWNPYEAIWLYLWQIENNPPACVNCGIGPLEHILGRAPTEAEKGAVAGVIQWFGTNCGHAFVVEVLNACGLKVWSDGSPHSEAVKNLQYMNVLERGTAEEVRIRHRGREVVLRPNSEGTVLD